MTSNVNCTTSIQTNTNQLRSGNTRLGSCASRPQGGPGPPPPPPPPPPPRLLSCKINPQTRQFGGPRWLKDNKRELCWNNTGPLSCESECLSSTLTLISWTKHRNKPSNIEIFIKEHLAVSSSLSWNNHRLQRSKHKVRFFFNTPVCKNSPSPVCVCVCGLRPNSQKQITGPLMHADWQSVIYIQGERYDSCLLKNTAIFPPSPLLVKPSAMGPAC